MNADETGTVVKPHKGYKCVLAITAVIPVLVCWFVWGLLSIIFYVDGLFNSKVAFGIGPILIPSVLVVGLLLSMRLVSCILRRCGLSTRRIRRGVLAMMFVFGLAALFGLNYMGLSLDPLSMFARGISRHVERRADIAEVQSWLSTVDPNDCEDQRLGDKIAPDRNSPHPPKYVPVPPALADLNGYGAILSKDDAGRPMICIFLGGSGLIGHWGVTVGDRDMPVPLPDSSELGESRFPLVPGAYVWFRE